MSDETRLRFREALRPVLDFGYEDMPDKQDEAITGILDIVREQLMSEEVIDIAAHYLSCADAYSETMQTDEEWREDAVSLMQDVIALVFDAKEFSP